MPKKKIKYPYEYDPKTRRLAKIYTKKKIIAGLVNGIAIPVIFLAFLLYSGGAKYIELASQGLIGNYYANVVLYGFMLISLMTLIQLPLRFYSGYIYDHKYRISNYNLGGWFRDFFKGLLIGYIIFMPLILALYYFISTQTLWWVYTGIFYAILFAFMSYISPVIIMPFFYKVEPYRDKRQIKRLLEMARKAGVGNIKNVFLAKESEKSKRANAVFMGFGKTKRIVLFDNLTDNFTDDEVETVVAHELGHYVGRDSLKFLLLETVKIFPVFFVIDIILRSYLGVFGIDNIARVAGLPLFLLSLFAIDFLLMPLENAYSRSVETRADLFALKMSKKPRAQISAEKRLSDMDLIDESAHPLIEFILFSHPSTKKRIELVERLSKQKDKAGYRY